MEVTVHFCGITAGFEWENEGEGYGDIKIGGTSIITEKFEEDAYRRATHCFLVRCIVRRQGSFKE